MFYLSLNDDKSILFYALGWPALRRFNYWWCIIYAFAKPGNSFFFVSKSVPGTLAPLLVEAHLNHSVDGRRRLLLRYWDGLLLGDYCGSWSVNAVVGNVFIVGEVEIVVNVHLHLLQLLENVYFSCHLLFLVHLLLQCWRLFFWLFIRIIRLVWAHHDI